MRSLRRNVTAIAAVSIAVLAHIALQFGIVFTRADFSLDKFRGFVISDQAAYLAIVTNAAQGQLDNMEPFTETGSIYYPRLYYLVLGAIAHVVGLDPWTAWALGGLVVQVVLVAAVAVACVALSGRPWTGLLGAVPFVLGTFSTVFNGVAAPSVEAAWYTPLASHAALWGPYAVLFPLNAEVVGLSLGGAALILLLLAYRRFPAGRARSVVVLIASAVIGTLANVQTYSFLSATFLAAYLVATVTIFATKRLWVGLASVALLVITLLLGPIVAGSTSPLIALMFGLLPAVPGLVVAIIRTRGLVAIAGAIAVACAAPSVISTLGGLRAGDPFLVYRVVASEDLGVPWQQGIPAAAVLLVPLALVLVAGIQRRNAFWVAVPIGVVLPWALLSGNDLWGPKQEPYRLWIDCFLLIAALTIPLLVDVGREYFASPEISRKSWLVAVVALYVVFAMASVSAMDYARFAIAQRSTMTLVSYTEPRAAAIGAAARAADGDLVMNGPCIDPRTAKVTSGEPIAWISLGLAWPTEYQAVMDLVAGWESGTFDVAAAHAAGVGYVITDSACDIDWGSDYADVLTDPVPFHYVGGVDPDDPAAPPLDGAITLWRVSGTQ